MSFFPFRRQMDSMDCGPACLHMIAKSYGRYYPLAYLRTISNIDRDGVSLKGISKAAERIGLRTMAVKIPFESKGNGASLRQASMPVIVHWRQNHFIVVYKLTRRYVHIADPAAGKHRLPIELFLRNWQSDDDKGVALLVEPTSSFETLNDVSTDDISVRFLWSYLKPYKRLWGQLGIGLIVSSALALMFPFLTQSIVDTGIVNQDISFIYLVLVGQVFLTATQVSVRFVQSWILLHIGMRLNVSLVSDFLAKLMRLPLGYFDSKNTGDILQRIGDHRRIESFLTQSTLGAVLSIFNMLAFSAILLYYSS